MAIIHRYNIHRHHDEWVVTDDRNILSVKVSREDAVEFLRIYKAIKARKRILWRHWRFSFWHW